MTQKSIQKLEKTKKQTALLFLFSTPIIVNQDSNWKQLATSIDRNDILGIDKLVITVDEIPWPMRPAIPFKVLNDREKYL